MTPEQITSWKLILLAVFDPHLLKDYSIHELQCAQRLIQAEITRIKDTINVGDISGTRWDRRRTVEIQALDEAFARISEILNAVPE